MRKNTILSVILSCSILISGIPAMAASNEDNSKKKENTNTLSVITQVPYADDNGNIHYVYKNEAGETVTLENGKKPATISRKKAAALPSSYSSVAEGKTTSIKNQGYAGACWAFSAVKALETSAIVKGLSPFDNTDYSESHLAWYTYHGETDQSSPLYGDTNLEYDASEDTYNQGGNTLLAVSTLSNWWGAANETDAPFHADTTDELRNMIQYMKSQDNSLRYHSDMHLKEANCYDNADLATIKQAIMEHGSMCVSMYYDADEIYTRDGEYSYYQTSYDDNYSNHAVTIVGWDDDFDLFSKTPKAKGAWLIANSYGESQEKTQVTKNGYFWVSYYEASLSDFYTLEAETADTYDTNYQYNGAGWNIALTSQDDISCANVFTNDTGKKQAVMAAGIYTVTDNQSYKISVYRKIAGTKPNTGKLAKSTVTTGTAAYAGYHTIPLANATNIEPGEKFAIVVEYDVTDRIAYVPMEGTEEDTYGYFQDSSGRYVEAKFADYSSESGQSFLDVNGTWTDTTSLKLETNSYFSSNEAENYNNICVKAFASNNTVADDPNDLVDIDDDNGNNNNPSVVTVTPSVSKYTIGAGERVTLSCTLSDVDQLTFSSSNKLIATVGNTGIITGIAPGTVDILLETASGGTAKVTVVVKKAPSKVTASVSKKTMKKGKTQKVKVKLPSGSASYRITYKSSKKSVATISKKGVIKAKKKGTAKITVTTFNNKKYTFKIKVKK